MSSDSSGRYGKPYCAVIAWAICSSVAKPSSTSTWPRSPPRAFCVESAWSSCCRLMTLRSSRSSPSSFEITRRMTMPATLLDNACDFDHPLQFLGVGRMAERFLIADQAAGAESVERLVHRLHALFLSGLDDGVHLVHFLIADQAADRVVGHHDLARHQPAAPLEPRQQLLREYAQQHEGQLRAHLVLLVRRKNIH